jgi:2-methylcitrate dehydratase PrpD
MGTVLGLIAVHGKAGLEEFDDYALTDPVVLRFLGCVTMEHDPDIEAAYPKNWIGRVEVVTRDGRRFEGRVVEPKGDPGNPLTQQEIVDKARALARYGGGVAPETVDRWIENILHLDDRPQFAGVFARE